LAVAPDGEEGACPDVTFSGADGFARGASVLAGLVPADVLLAACGEGAAPVALPLADGDCPPV